MKNTKPLFSQVIWFRKWNRKAYAVFRSLGLVVHIAGLSAAVADASLLKTSKNGLGGGLNLLEYNLNWNDILEDEKDISFFSILLNQLAFAVFTINQINHPAKNKFSNLFIQGCFWASIFQ